MDPHAAVRFRARQAHAEALAHNGGDRSARALTQAAADLRDVTVVPFAPGTRFGLGVLGCFERVGMLISVDATLSPVDAALVVAHEIGHCDLHDDPVNEVVNLDPANPALPGGIVGMTGYSPRERREVEAETFALEFLCPADWLRTELLDGHRPAAVAAILGLPPVAVMRQAVRAALLPQLVASVPALRDDPPLDTTQRAAAEHAGGPLLVVAGPGTGKTAALAGRVRRLLATGVEPDAILILTFSNRAAAELRARVAAIAPGAASMWIGTFHSLGLEVIHRWHDRIGRGPAPRVLDRDGSLDLIERNLDRVPKPERILRDPVAVLSPVLRAIGRCKDELVGPAEYAAAARAAALDGEGEAVEAALDLAATYAAYERLLAEADAVDLGDLVALATRILVGNDDVARHYGGRFRHVLVDEYQDVNHASIQLLQSLCGPGTALWAVGDTRQAIYRFRGAADDAPARFADDFGGETVELGHNYRSGRAIVDAFAAFSAGMRGGAGAWRSERGNAGTVTVTEAPTVEAEGAAIAAEIERLRQAGVGYRDQAVLARTHLTLDRIGAALERRGIPLLHLGDLFARPEVRDLLAVLSAAAEPGGVGLIRAAALAPYDVPRADALATVRWAHRHDLPVAAAAMRARSIPGRSGTAATGLERLGRFLAGTAGQSAWGVLTSWLFDTADIIRPLTTADDAAAATRRAATYQLLDLAANEPGGPARLLARIRRIAALGEGRDHGVVAPEAESTDAVRLMTVHAAKGLEFDAVHLAGMATGYAPLARRRPDNPPPPGLERLALAPADHDAEERALAFVALSRARDHLALSFARRYTPGRASAPSPYLGRIGAVEANVAPAVADPATVDAALPQPRRTVHLETDLRTYMACPARYRYEVVDDLADVAPLAATRAARRCVTAAVGRIEAAAQADSAPNEAAALASLRAEWAVEGPVGHPLEAQHRAVAGAMVAQVAGVIGGEAGARYYHGSWIVDVGPGRVSVSPDRVIERPWGVTVQVMRAGRPRHGGCEPIHALLLEGARRCFPDARITVETLDVVSGEAHAPDVTRADEAITPYRDTILAIERGEYTPRPDARRCPGCPFLFACGA